MMIPSVQYWHSIINRIRREGDKIFLFKNAKVQRDQDLYVTMQTLEAKTKGFNSYWCLIHQVSRNHGTNTEQEEVTSPLPKMVSCNLYIELIMIKTSSPEIAIKCTNGC